MYDLLKSIGMKYKGWLIALTLGIAISMLTNHRTVRQISVDYLRHLINRREIARITVVKSRLSIRERYTAEITLTSNGLKRYNQKGITFSSSEMGPHLVVFAGSSTSEVNQWELNLNDGNRNYFPVEKSY